MKKPKIEEEVVMVPPTDATHTLSASYSGAVNKNL